MLSPRVQLMRESGNQGNRVARSCCTSMWVCGYNTQADRRVRWGGAGAGDVVGEDQLGARKVTHVSLSPLHMCRSHRYTCVALTVTHVSQGRMVLERTNKGLVERPASAPGHSSAVASTST
eukprot:5437422-Pyramimonas_sp.AAC.1